MSTSSSTGLVRAIGRWGFVAVVINSVIGSGIFALPAPVAGFAGAWSPVPVLIAGAGVFLVVLCLAEVAGRFEESGGPYLFTREAFGSLAGFEAGWLQTCTRFLGAAAVLNVLVAYFGQVVPLAASRSGRALTMTVAMASATYVNVIGVRHGSKTVNLFTIAKLLPLILLIAIGVTRVNHETLASQVVAERHWTDAVLLLIFAYGGSENAVVAAGELKNPKRDTAFALIVSLLGVIAIYALIQLVVVGVLPAARDATAPVAEALRILLGSAGFVIATFAVLVSIYGWIVGNVLTVPRILFAMSSRGELPRVLARVHPEYRTPHVAIISTSIVSLALGLAGGFTQLATFSVICRLAIFGATCAGMIQLRRREGKPATFRAPGGSVTAIAGIFFTLWLLSTRNLSEAWVLPVALLIGWLFWRARRVQSAIA